MWHPSCYSNYKVGDKTYPWSCVSFAKLIDNLNLSSPNCGKAKQTFFALNQQKNYSNAWKMSYQS